MELLKEKLEDIVNSIKRWNYRISKLIDFIKLGWNDEDYDHGFLTDIILYKLNKMEERIKYDAYLENTDKVTTSIRVAKKALIKWQKTEHFSDKLEKIQRIKTDFGWRPSDKGGEFTRMVTVYEGTDVEVSKEDKKLISEDYSSAHDYERRMGRKYKKIFFRTMFKHYNNWWN